MAVILLNPHFLSEPFVVEYGLFLSNSGGLIGRLSKLPPQFGHLPPKTFSAHSIQNVHSNEQITASPDSGGRFLLQHSQFCLISNTS